MHQLIKSNFENFLTIIRKIMVTKSCLFGEHIRSFAKKKTAELNYLD